MARIPRNDPPPFQTDDTLVCLTMKWARQVEKQIADYYSPLWHIANGSSVPLTTREYRNIARRALGMKEL